MTREEFTKMYAWNSQVSARELIDMGFLPLECACGEDNCRGWKMVHRSNTPLLMDLYNTREEIDQAEEWASAYLEQNHEV
jgi:hypothetical protein